MDSLAKVAKGLLEIFAILSGCVTLKMFGLVLSCIKLRNGQTYFKNLAVFTTQDFYPAGNEMFNVNNKNTRTKCEICSKLTKKKLKRRQWF